MKKCIQTSPFCNLREKGGTLWRASGVTGEILFHDPGGIGHLMIQKVIYLMCVVFCISVLFYNKIEKAMKKKEDKITKRWSEFFHNCLGGQCLTEVIGWFNTENLLTRGLWVKFPPIYCNLSCAVGLFLKISKQGSDKLRPWLSQKWWENRVMCFLLQTPCLVLPKTSL